MRLTAVTYGGDWTNLYEFRPVDGSPVPEFTAGSHVDLYLPKGIIRQYSLVNSELDRSRYLLGIKRDRNSRGGSRYLHDSLRVGEMLRLSAPRNNFPLNDKAPAVFIAGGIGITPIRCMIDRAARQGQDWQLHYSVQRRAEAVFLAEFAEFSSRVHLHVDAEHDGRLLDLAAIVAAAPRQAHLYCCGPAGMLDAFLALTKDRPAEQVHVERFTATVPPPASGIGDFVVELARSKRRIPVPAGRTILDVLREAGVEVSSSCEQGVCGACETPVISGTPEHRDMLLSDEEKARGKTMMICCSLSRSEVLVLDL